MRLATLTVLVCLLSRAVFAQAPICRTFIVPDQGRQANGNSARQPLIAVPPVAADGNGIYPVAITMPANATSLGVEFWTHHYGGVDIPPGRIILAALLHRPDLRGPLANDNAPFIQWYDDGKSHNDNLSLRLAPGESYQVGIWNFGSQPVNVFLMVTFSICFNTSREMAAYTAQVEP